jgi:hypothetical protein
MKKFFLFLIAVSLSVACFADVDGTAGTLTGSLSDAGTLTISGTGAMPDYSYYDVPWHIYWNTIRQVIISDGVTNIGNSAFSYCSSLT